MRASQCGARSRHPCQQRGELSNGRFEKPEEVAAVVTFVASAQGAILYGATLRAEGDVVRSVL